MTLSVTQNFLKDEKLVAKLVQQAGMYKNETVLDLGAGKGIITKELAKYCQKVIAVELDPILVEQLKKETTDLPKVEIVSADILSYQLPAEPYKVFSNIPFNITSDIVNKLLFAPNSPEDCFLIMQKAAADRFMGKGEGTLISLLLKPVFDLSVVHNFDNTDFDPAPNVDVVLFRAKKQMRPVIDVRQVTLYRDFVSYVLMQQKDKLKKRVKKLFLPAEYYAVCNENKIDPIGQANSLSFEQWLALFKLFIAKHQTKFKYQGALIVRGCYDDYLNNREYQPKEHRTRAFK